MSSSILKDFNTLAAVLEQSAKQAASFSRVVEDHLRSELDTYGGELFHSFEKHWLDPILVDLGHDPKAFSVDVRETVDETIQAEGMMLQNAVRDSLFAGEDVGERDMMLRAAAPVMCVPKLTQFFPLANAGHRFLVARDGLWIEVRRPWLHLIYPLARQKAIAMPYGDLTVTVEMVFDKQDQYGFIRDMARRGRECLPNERGNWVSYEHGLATAPRLVWAQLVDTVGTPATLDYQRPEHGPSDCPCIDIHTHGLAAAGFSATDDTDDAGDVKISIVLGNLDQPVPTIAARLCCLGLFIPVPVKAEEIFGAAA
jgi:PRTRC genetic system protein A